MTERERFEAWARSDSVQLLLNRNPEGNYHYWRTHTAYAAWQARSSRAGAGVTEEELAKAIYPDCEELAGPDTKADYVRVFADSIARTALAMMKREK